MVDVEIEYCVPCGHLDTAIDTQRELLETFGRRLDGVRLSTGDGGVFTVMVDDTPIWDKNEDGYNLDAIVDAVEPHVGATA